MPPAVGGGGSASSRFRHPQIQLRQLPERGAGYVATGLLKRGELLLEVGMKREPFGRNMLEKREHEAEDVERCSRLTLAGEFFLHGPMMPHVFFAWRPMYCKDNEAKHSLCSGAALHLGQWQKR